MAMVQPFSLLSSQAIVASSLLLRVLEQPSSLLLRVLVQPSSLPF